jgi:phosphonate transport system substrate-binding protein
MTMTHRIFAAIACLAAAGLGRAADDAPLKVALLPDESPATVIQNNQALEAYLEKAIGRPIELVVTTDYSSMIEAMRFKRIDLGYFGPLSYVLARSRSEIEPFAALVSKGKTTYTSVLVAHAGAGIATPADVRGKTVGFGDPASTSSHLIPRSLLKGAGLEGGTDYSFHHLGAHDAVARAVQAGHVQAGALSRPIFESLVEKQIIDPAKVKIVAESRPIPNYPWTMRADLPASLKDRIRRAFYELKDPGVLRPFKGEGFQPVTDSDYDVLRETAKVLSLDLTRVKG